MTNDRCQELFSDVCELCVGHDSREAVGALTACLAAVVINGTMPDRREAAIEDVVRSLRANVAEMIKRAGSPRPARER